MINFFVQCLRREAILGFRESKTLINSCLFFLMMMAFFPLSFNASTKMMHDLSQSIYWVALMLSILLIADRVFQRDHEDGAIEQYLVSGQPVSLMILAKIGIQWFLFVTVMVFSTPVVGFLFSWSLYEIVVAIVTMILSTPALIGLATLAAAFGLGLRQNGVIMALILLPLTLPVMVFSSGTLSMAREGVVLLPYFSILFAITLIVTGFIPVTIAIIIKNNNS